MDNDTTELRGSEPTPATPPRNRAAPASEPSSGDTDGSRHPTASPTPPPATDSQSSRRALSRLVDADFSILVVTNGSPRQQDMIEHLGLKDLVHGVAVSSIVGVRKPSPGIFEAAARDAGLKLDDVAWMVGDSPEADIRGAAAIGARSAWLSRGRQWPLTDLYPSVTATDFSGAVDLVLGHGPHGSIRSARYKPPDADAPPQPAV